MSDLDEEDQLRIDDEGVENSWDPNNFIEENGDSNIERNSNDTNTDAWRRDIEKNGPGVLLEMMDQTNPPNQ